MKKILITLCFFSLSSFAQDALVWGGPGVCPDGCVDAAIHVTQLAGFNPMIVTPENFDPALLEKAKVWVQPGGKAATAAKAMGPEIRKAIREFVAAGGGYTGFCAGGFLTTPKVGRTDVDGLGIIDGKTKHWRKSRGNPSVEKLLTSSGLKHHYWEGGPYFIFSSIQRKKINIVSRYLRGGAINALEASYGLGRVSTSGTHPEAPKWWYEDIRFSDPDDLDHYEAARMIKWSASAL